MAKDEVSQSDITVRGDPSSRLYNVRSSSSDSRYTVDGVEESCTCVAWSVGRNRAVRDGLGAHFRCKHVWAVVEYEARNGTAAAQELTTAAAKKEKEHADIDAEFQRIKRVARLKKDLKELREDV